MGIKATNKGGDYTPPPADVYSAVCVGVFDLGTQQSQFGQQRKVSIMWELDHRKEDGKRFTISMRVTPSVNKKATFRSLLEKWSGRKVTPEEEKEGFDMAKLLGKPCQLQVTHAAKDGNTYANVEGVLKLMNGQTPLQPEHPLVSYSWDDHGKNIPEGVPEFIQKAIKESLEWRGLIVEPAKDEEKPKEPTLQEQAAGVF